MLMVSLLAAGCAAQSGTAGIAAEKLLADETVSFPAEQGDAIEYSVKVYQDADNKIKVTADSNSAFFDAMEYEVAYGKALTESDVDVKWTTLMGDPEPKEDDQWAAAVITISHDGDTISQRKINFVTKGMEIIAGVTDQNANP